MKQARKWLGQILCLLVAAACMTACNQQPGGEPGELTLATTTSTEDSGLLHYLLPYFREDSGWNVRVISVGTGAALQLGRDGEADVLLVHARSEEDRFVEEGYAEARYDIMYNDFVIAGPENGPILHNTDAPGTFAAILEQNLPFISRGDNSGTHIRELDLWDYLGLVPEDNAGYMSVGQGMGASLGMAVELNAYILVDRATWLSFRDRDELIIISEGHPELLNPYGILIAATTELPAGARIFVDWMRSERGQALIGAFGVEEFGQPLFFPDAGGIS